MKQRADTKGPSAGRPDASGFAFPHPGPALAALTTSALALPGIAGSAKADAPIERATATSSFSYYFEDNLSPSRFATGQGSRERYEVYTGQFRFDVPVAERIDVGLDVLYEEMSGASPWYVIADTNGDSVQVMSGATIEDERVEVTADVDFYLDTGKDTASFGFSKEKDYLSLYGGIGAERNFNDRNTTLSVSGALSYDWIEPTDANSNPTRPESKEKWSVDLFAGLSQILTRASALQATINYKHSDGYLSDPYKLVATLGGGTGNVGDSRPDSKDQVSLLLRYRHHIEPITASIHADYRLYADDFGVTSHTIELAWYQNLFEWLTLTPSARWYSQSKADFYEAILAPGSTPNHRSSDYRLSPYGAFAWKIAAEVELEDLWDYDAPRWLQAVGVANGLDLIAGLSYERYYSDGDFAIQSVSEKDEAPSLVRFRVVAFTLSGRF